MSNSGLRDLIESLRGSASNNSRRREAESALRSGSSNIDFMSLLRSSMMMNRERPTRRRELEHNDYEEAMITLRPEMHRTCGFDPEREEREYKRNRMRRRFGRSSSDSDDSPERRKPSNPPPMPNFKLRPQRSYMNIMRLFDRSERGHKENG